MQTFSLPHPELGQLVGLVRDPRVVQFRGVPFGRIPARWRQARLATELTHEEKQCTKYGNACPQFESSMEAFGGPIPGEPEKTYDELTCLNLTVTAPLCYLEDNMAGKLPVMVYVHGGGFAEGAHYGAVHDCTRMVRLSVDDGQPVVIVSIHYRLNFFGLLACKDMVDEAARNGEPPCNFALYDQRLAFQWVRKYIHGFAGDPCKITAFGESAGSASLSYHMCSTVPIFNQVILESGSPSTIPASPMEEKEASYLAVLKYCSIAEDDPQRLEKLRQISPQRLLDAKRALQIFAHSPLAHESFFPVSPTYSNQCEILSKCDWVKAIVIGDCVYEGYLFCEQLKHVKAERFVKLLEANIGRERTTKLLSIYQIAPDMDRNLFWTRLNTYVGDVMFSMPVHQIARAVARTEKKVYRYTLSLRNPFHGSIFGGVLGHHFIDLLYQFMTLLERYPEKRQKLLSIQFARYWIDFANLKEPWPNLALEDGESREIIAVADSREGWIIRPRKVDEELSELGEGGPRRYEHWDTLISVFDQLGQESQQAIDEISFPRLMAVVDS